MLKMRFCHEKTKIPIKNSLKSNLFSLIVVVEWLVIVPIHTSHLKIPQKHVHEQFSKLRGKRSFIVLENTLFSESLCLSIVVTPGIDFYYYCTI